MGSGEPTELSVAKAVGESHDGMSPIPITVTLDTNLFYDKAEAREGVGDVDAILEHSRQGRLRLYFTSTTDFEASDSRGASAMRFVRKLVLEGVLIEDLNAGTSRDYMPGGPGLHRVEDAEIDELVEKIWPNAKVLGFSYESKRRDACHLIAHKLNKRDVFLTRDHELLAKHSIIKEALGATVMSPEELLERVSAG